MIALVPIAKALLLDAGLYLALLIVILTLRKLKRLRAARVVTILTGMLFALQCSPFPVQWISKILYAESARLAAEAEASGCLRTYGTVVVLGGGLASPELPDVGSQMRLLAAARYLSAAGRAQDVIVTGGVTSDELKLHDAEVYESFLRDHLAKTPAHRFLRFAPATNTREEALQVRASLDARHLPLSVVLVTSTSHMPRAAATFRKAGIEICAWPAPSYETLALHAFSFRNATGTRLFMNEVMGIAAYRLWGWL